MPAFRQADRLCGEYAKLRFAFVGLPRLSAALDSGSSWDRPPPQGNNSLDLYPNANKTLKTGE